LDSKEIGSQVLRGFYVSSISQTFTSKKVTSGDYVGRRCPFYDQFLRENPGFRDPRPGFYPIKSNVFNVCKAASLFGDIDKDFLHDINLPILCEAVQSFLDGPLRKINGFCKIWDAGAVRMKASTSGGFMSKDFDLRSKSDFIATHGDLVYPYWNTFHKSSFIELWREFGKEELTKESKFNADDIRTIICSPPLLYYAGMMAEGHFNDLYHTVHDVGIGWSKFYGGVDKLVRRLSGYNERGDVWKWDRHMQYISMCVCQYVRWECLSDEYKTYDNWLRFKRLLYEKVFTLRVLPNAQIIQKLDGNSTGSWSTSTDNDVWHQILRRYVYRLLTDMPCSTYTKHVVLTSYADDYVEDSDDFILNHGYLPDLKVAEFAKMGMKLILEDPPFIKGPLGVEFLGGRVIFRNGHYVMEPCRPGKFQAALIWPDKREDLNLALQRVTALWSESFGDEILFSKIGVFREWLINHGASLPENAPSEFLRLRKKEDVAKLWFGQE